jgi:hypothetical protein
MSLDAAQKEPPQPVTGALPSRAGLPTLREKVNHRVAVDDDDD